MTTGDFDRLAKLLDDTYSFGYTDRYEALRQFGNEHKSELEAIEAQGRTLEQLVDKAQLGAPEHWAREIRKGMQ